MKNWLPAPLAAIAACMLAVSVTMAAPPRPSSDRLARVVGTSAVPNGLGVNVHFTSGHAAELRQIADFGFRVVRTDLLWANVEHMRGVFDWSRYDAFVADARYAGLTPMLILDYSNPLYAAPTTSHDTSPSRAFAAPVVGDARAAFMRFADAAASHFGPNVIWEVWNEPNLNFGSPVDPEGYIGFAMDVCRTVRRASPEAPVIGPATNGFAWRLLQHFLSADNEACFDAISVHPYRSRAPDDVLDDWTELGRMACEGRLRCPALVNSEWGYSSFGGPWTEARQAEYVGRLYLLDLLAGVPVTIVYDWRDDADLPGEMEANFGLLSHRGTPKLIHDVLRGIVQDLQGLTLIGRVSAGGTHAVVLAFGRNGRATTLVGWSESGSEDVTVPAGACILAGASASACSMHNLDLPVPVSLWLTSRPSIQKIQ